MYLAADLRVVEEAELLLVTQHLQRRLAEHREVQRLPVGCRVGEHELVRQRGLPCSRLPDDDVEGSSGQPPPRMSSSFAIPDGSRLMRTRGISFIDVLCFCRRLDYLSAPNVRDYRQNEIPADEGDERFQGGRENRDKCLLNCGRPRRSGVLAQPLCGQSMTGQLDGTCQPRLLAAGNP